MNVVGVKDPFTDEFRCTECADSSRFSVAVWDAQEPMSCGYCKFAWMEPTAPEAVEGVSDSGSGEGCAETITVVCESCPQGYVVRKDGRVLGHIWEMEFDAHYRLSVSCFGEKPPALWDAMGEGAYERAIRKLMAVYK
jgi:hypothetical protein